MPSKEESKERKSKGDWWKSWIEPTLIVPIIGAALILVLGQMITTYVDIKYGVEDSSDFNIIAEPPSGELKVSENEKLVNITVKDRHEVLCPYGHTVCLKAKPTEGLRAEFLNNSLKPPFTTKMKVWPILPRNETDQKVIIEGIGGDGRRRNTTYELTVEPLREEPERPSAVIPREEWERPVGISATISQKGPQIEKEAGI